MSAGPSPCRYCNGENLKHEDWCRENIPVRKRVEAWMRALISIGYSSERIDRAATDADREALDA